MNLIKFSPARWFSNEDDDKSLAVRRRGATPRDAFHSEVDRMFDDLFSSFGFPSAAPFRGRVGGDVMLKPSLDLGASDKEYIVAMELPGVDEKDISIEVSKGTLVISGEKKQELEDKDEQRGMYRVERSYGSFQRALALPEDADVDNIKAGFDKGVLRVTVPRTEIRDTKRVEITKDQNG